MIGIITVHEDVHALAVMRELIRRGYTDCKIIAVDKIRSIHRLALRIGIGGVTAKIATEDGSAIRASDLRVLWLRRPTADQLDLFENEPRTTADLINNECRGAIAGLLGTGVEGRWISTIEATVRASDKLVQLNAAHSCGFRIPETLVSQSQSEVAEFFHRFNGKVIVKPIVGVQGPILLTRFMGNPLELDEASFEVCPGLYQEFISGTRHIRLNCFGNRSFAASIDTEDLDWRPNLNVPIHAWRVSDDLHCRVRRVLDHLGLEMGIIDIKEAPSGELIWLEVNPQGQLLFLESLTNEPLASHFADFLLSFLD
jgi:hypothetical protein